MCTASFAAVCLSAQETTSVATGDRVSVVQFGHLFAKGDTRDAAIRAMVVALKEVKIRGEIRTTVDYTAEMIQSADFVGNNIHTGWLDNRIATHVSPSSAAWSGPDLPHILLDPAPNPPAADLPIIRYWPSCLSSSSW